jgi:hypothetical protein
VHEDAVCINPVFDISTNPYSDNVNGDLGEVVHPYSDSTATSTNIIRQTILLQFTFIGDHSE